MERAGWTDERLDDLAGRVDRGFERLDADIRQLRDQIGAQGVELRGEIAALRITMIRVGGAVMAGLVGVIAAVLAAGG
jgi:hypothetical protein